MGGLFGGGDVDYKMSGEQKNVYQALLPLLRGLSGFGQTNAGLDITGFDPRYGSTDLGAPYAPYMPSAEGVMSGANLYDIPMYGSAPSYNVPQTGTVDPYGVPDAYSVPGAVMPSQGWYSGLSPSVMQGVWEPYNEGARQMMETFGGTPGAGAGRSGAHAAALGKYYADASKDVGLQAWQMAQPGMMAAWQGQLGANQDAWRAGLGAEQAAWGANVGRGDVAYQAQLGASRDAWQEEMGRQGKSWQAELARNMGQYGNVSQERMMDYQQELARQQADYASAMQQWQMPWNTIGLIGGTYPAGVQNPSTAGGMFGGGLMGGLGAASVFGAGNWPMIGAGALLGGLGGMF